MKKLVFLFTLVLLGQGFAVAPRYHKNLFQLHHHVPQQPNADYKFCGMCIQFADQFLDALLNIILNAGVVGGCTELCGLLPSASPIEEDVCMVLCGLVGFVEFVKIVQEADLDPIYYCELLKTCEIKDDGDATITQLLVKPKLVERGSTFEISFAFTTKNGTGTGEVYLGIHTQDGIPLGQSELMKPLPAGQTATTDGTVSTTPGTICIDEGFCEEWRPGNYTVVLAVCNGQCGSNHPHSQLYDLQRASFNITENNIKW